jgi:hypothetical protein
MSDKLGVNKQQQVGWIRLHLRNQRVMEVTGIGPEGRFLVFSRCQTSVSSSLLFHFNRVKQLLSKVPNE